MRGVTLAALLTLSLVAVASAQQFSGGFPFHLPADDSVTVEYLPRFPARPITEADRVTAVGEDFHRGGEQIRFFGANFVADGAFPLHEESDLIAGRFRKLGFNLARFHHLDNPWSDHGIFPRNGSTRALDPVQLDRLEYLIARLKEEGVYVNMNLHVSRTFTEADGVADADSILDFGKGVTYFDPQLIALQKEYASQLLRHTNPHTGLPLAEDPVLAMLEITNENSLYVMWRNGQLTGFRQGGNLIQRHVDLLDELWIEHLRDRYGSTETLSSAWNLDVLTEGSERIVDGGFESSVAGQWQLEYHGGAQASVSSTAADVFEGARAARVDVTTTGPEDWRVQWKQVGISILEDTTYTVRFALRAETERSIPVGIQLNVDPWTVYSSYSAAAGTDWRTFEFTFTAPQTVSGDIRLSFTMGGETGSVWVDAVSMRRAGRLGLESGESLEAESVVRLPFSEVLKYSSARLHDTSGFYIALQTAYFQEMMTYLRDELGVQAPMNGTNWNFGLVDLASQSTADYMDNHSYWDHPQFPGTPWSSTDWLINNTAMVNARDGGTIGRLMAGVAPSDKPYTISEYNHAFPNRYQSEAPLFLTAYSAFHDVDGLMFFDYSGSSNWTEDRVSGYFSIHRNPAMMALMPSLAYAYREGLVSEDRSPLTVRYGPDQVLGFPALEDGSWGGASLFPRELALEHRIVTESYESSSGTNVEGLPSVQGPPFVAGRGTIRWDPDGLLTVEGHRFFAATGFLDRFEGAFFGQVEIVEADGFGTVTLLALDDYFPFNGGRALVTLSTASQNTGMTWDGTATVHNNWGSAPVEIEPARVVLRYHYPVLVKTGSEYVVMSVLDGAGAVVSSREVDHLCCGLTLELDQHTDRTMWWGVQAFLSPGGSGDDSPPATFRMGPVYPNPASGAAQLDATLPGGRASLEVFDLLGRRVRLVSVHEPAGDSTLELNVSDLSPGVYHLRLTAGGAARTRTLVVQ